MKDTRLLFFLGALLIMLLATSEAFSGGSVGDTIRAHPMYCVEEICI